MYNPQKSLLKGIELAFPKQLFPWDDYFARMAETDWLSGRANIITAKSFFMRNAPFGGSYALMGGITDALRSISELRFDNSDFKDGMLDMGYSNDFVEWLAARKRLRLQVHAPYEGTVIYPQEPIVTVLGPLSDVRFVEGILTEAMNFPTLCLTKWHRLINAVYPARVLEFSRRRAQNAKKATLCGILAGCFATSNSEMRRFFDVSVIGTMGHEWVQGFGDVKTAFSTWLRYQPGKAVGLVDTKQCLEHDFPLWLDAVYENKEAIKSANAPTWGWRNDSGDLAHLAVKQREMFLKHKLAQDEWFVKKYSIVLTNDLDEYSAQSIIQQTSKEACSSAPEIIGKIVWAAGTKPGTCEDQPSLGGVAKLMEIGGQACIKLAFDAEGKPGVKTSIPGFNKSAVICDQTSGEIKSLIIYPARRYEIKDWKFFDTYSHSNLDSLVVCDSDKQGAHTELRNYYVTTQQALLYDSFSENGFTKCWYEPQLSQVADTIRNGVSQLHPSMKRLDHPHKMKISVTSDLFDLRMSMIQQGVLREDFLSK